MDSSSRILIGLATVLLNTALVAPASVHARGSGDVVDSGRLIEQLSRADLEAFYLRCSRAALQQALGGMEIALCSVGYEVLLTRNFGGDFHAFLAWSRRQGDGVAETAFHGDTSNDRE